MQVSKVKYLRTYVGVPTWKSDRCPAQVRPAHCRILLARQPRSHVLEVVWCHVLEVVWCALLSRNSVQSMKAESRISGESCKGQVIQQIHEMQSCTQVSNIFPTQPTCSQLPERAIGNRQQALSHTKKGTPYPPPRPNPHRKLGMALYKYVLETSHTTMKNSTDRL